MRKYNLEFSITIQKSIVVLIFFFAGFLSLTMAMNNGRIQNEKLSPGFHKQELELPGGEILKYGVWIPAMIPMDTVPFILALHYGGEVVPWYGMSFMELLVEPAFSDLGAIIIAPDCPGKGWTDPVSEQAVFALLEYSIESLPVDKNRIVVTGFSMGGTGTWFLAVKYPGKFSAAIPIAGRPDGNEEVEIPIYAIHGAKDEIVNVKPVKQAIKILRKNGTNAKLVMVTDLTHYQTSAYVDPLKATIYWLKRVWRVQLKERESKKLY